VDLALQLSQVSGVLVLDLNRTTLTPGGK